MISLINTANTGSLIAHQAVDETQGGLSEGGHDGVGDAVAESRLDEATREEVGNSNQPTAIAGRVLVNRHGIEHSPLF